MWRLPQPCATVAVFMLPLQSVPPHPSLIPHRLPCVPMAFVCQVSKHMVCCHFLGVLSLRQLNRHVSVFDAACGVCGRGGQTVCPRDAPCMQGSQAGDVARLRLLPGAALDTWAAGAGVQHRPAGAGSSVGAVLLPCFDDLYVVCASQGPVDTWGFTVHRSPYICWFLRCWMCVLVGLHSQKWDTGNFATLLPS